MIKNTKTKQVTLVHQQMVPERVKAIETTAQLPRVIDVISVLCSLLFRALWKQ